MTSGIGQATAGEGLRGNALALFVDFGDGLLEVVDGLEEVVLLLDVEVVPLFASSCSSIAARLHFSHRRDLVRQILWRAASLVVEFALTVLAKSLGKLDRVFLTNFVNGGSLA